MAFQPSFPLLAVGGIVGAAVVFLVFVFRAARPPPEDPRTARWWAEQRARLDERRADDARPPRR